MRKFVLDASALAPLYFWDEADRISDDDRESILSARLCAPAHWPFDIANMLLVAQRRRRITDADHLRALSLTASLSVDINAGSQAQALAATFDLAVADNLTIYDAAYLELARRERCGLFTLDQPLALAARSRGIETPLLP